MKSLWKWVLGIVAAVVVLSILAMPLMMARFYGFGGYGMMSGPRSSWGWPMHGGFGGWMPMMGGGGFGWMGFGMVFSALVQLGVLILIVLGIVWLVRAINRQGQKPG
jgi:uncharacterized membrane protein